MTTILRAWSVARRVLSHPKLSDAFNITSILMAVTATARSAPKLNKKKKSAVKKAKTPKTKSSSTRRKPHFDNVKVYIGRTVKAVLGSKKGLSDKAVCALNGMCMETLEKISTEAIRIMHANKQVTFSVSTVAAATKVVLSGELARDAASAGTAAALSFKTNKKGKSSTRARLHFSPSRVSALVKTRHTPKRFSPLAGAFLAAVLQYLVVEVTDGARVFLAKKKRVTSRMVALVVRNDSELNFVFTGSFRSAGVPVTVKPRVRTLKNA